jgi:hypothetical protein
MDLEQPALRVVHDPAHETILVTTGDDRDMPATFWDTYRALAGSEQAARTAEIRFRDTRAADPTFVRALIMARRASLGTHREKHWRSNYKIVCVSTANARAIRVGEADSGGDAVVVVPEAEVLERVKDLAPEAFAGPRAVREVVEAIESEVSEALCVRAVLVVRDARPGGQQQLQQMAATFVRPRALVQQGEELERAALAAVGARDGEGRVRFLGWDDATGEYMAEVVCVA